MSAVQVVANYRSLLQTARRIRDAAAREDWESLSALAKEQQPLVGTIKTLDASVALDDAARQSKDALIQEILATEAETRQSISAWMQRLDQELGEGRRELRMLREYARNAG